MSTRGSAAGHARCNPVTRCAYPLTGLACVSRVYTDLAVIDVTAAGLRAIERVPGLSFDELQALTAVPLLP